MTFSIQLEIEERFDGKRWQVCSAAAPASTVLLSWRVTPEPVDAGVPEPVARCLANALLRLGDVYFGGDESEAGVGEAPVASIELRGGLRRHVLQLFCADEANAVLPAFDSAVHPWTRNAQWLLVSRRLVGRQGVDEGLKELVQRLYREGKLPPLWPKGVAAIVQAAVDGDGAGCSFEDEEARERFLAAMGEAAAEAGIILTTR